ncbi:RNA-directed DNA polymerase, eukaryota [Tanacetum coccineum]
MGKSSEMLLQEAFEIEAGFDSINSLGFIHFVQFDLSFQRSGEDHVIHISKSIFVTNFPKDCGSRDLWKVCEGYRKVVDVYIPNRRSKSGRFHLQANVVRYERVSKNVKSTGNLASKVQGKVKDIESIPNLRTLLSKEGFPKVKLSYLGGLWVMIELENEASKRSLLDHVGVKSWFHIMQEATQDFVSEERVVWVDIEGVPLNMWSRETFLKIRGKWGSALDIEDNSGSSFARKRICVLTKEPDSILEKFKVIYKGKVSMVRAKELFTWTPIFMEPQEMVYTSDGDSVQGDKSKSADAQLSDGESDEESDVDGVSETVFGENSSSHHVSGRKKDIQQSEDPFYVSEVHKDGGRDDDTIANDVEKEKTPSVHANDVRCKEERLGSLFNPLGARLFNKFIKSSGLVEVKLEGYSFTWPHPSASKMSKLDRFLVTEGMLSVFPSMSVICLDRHLSDHRPILLHEVYTDYGLTPFRFYLSWFRLNGFDDMVKQAWQSFSHSDSNSMIRFKKKLQALKPIIRCWVKDRNS